MEKQELLSNEECMGIGLIEEAIIEVNALLPESKELFVYTFLGYIHKKQMFQIVISYTKEIKPNYIKDLIIYVENENYIINYSDVIRELPITPNNALSIVHFAKLYFPLFNLKKQ